MDQTALQFFFRHLVHVPLISNYILSAEITVLQVFVNNIQLSHAL